LFVSFTRDPRNSAALDALQTEVLERSGSQPGALCFVPTRIAGAYVIQPEPCDDERGFFARTFCAREFELHGLNPRIAQCSISFNARKGTLRGMHYQVAPHAETKLVRCTRGGIYDVLVDLRTDSPTNGEWIAVELTSENRKTIFVPEGVAHGFQTLQDGAEVLYQMSEFHYADCARGRRWNDPAFDIRWPSWPTVISEKDANFALLSRDAAGWA
jgi:dTDP-4-dehydrorhamnose 3,5-epimerase